MGSFQSFTNFYVQYFKIIYIHLMYTHTLSFLSRKFLFSFFHRRHLPVGSRAKVSCESSCLICDIATVQCTCAAKNKDNCSVTVLRDSNWRRIFSIPIAGNNNFVPTASWFISIYRHSHVSSHTLPFSFR